MTPREKILCWSAETMHEALDVTFDCDPSWLGIASPIERIFIEGVYAYVSLCCLGNLVKMPNATPIATPYTAVGVIPQYKIGNYRADFLVCDFRSAPGYWVVVECDGHDFHNANKHQVERDKARDRAITAAGFPVYRFTGSELYRDPMKCVRELFDVFYAEGARQRRENEAESDA